MPLLFIIGNTYQTVMSITRICVGQNHFGIVSLPVNHMLRREADIGKGELGKCGKGLKRKQFGAIQNEQSASRNSNQWQAKSLVSQVHGHFTLVPAKVLGSRVKNRFLAGACRSSRSQADKLARNAARSESPCLQAGIHPRSIA